MNIFEKVLPAEDRKLKWVSILITLLITGPLTLWGIYGIGEYGMALFILVPILLGATPVLLYGHNKELKNKEAYMLGFLTLAMFAVGLLVCAIEGVICILIASPLGILFTALGVALARAVQRKRKKNAPTSLLILILIVPVTAFIENKSEADVVAVTTSIEIQASREEVWKNVIRFPDLDEPTEFLFKAGISYPTNAEIEGEGVGAVRHCHFTTGSFVEPITTWDEPGLLAFDVDDCPPPMSELNIWDIDAPHLHDFFVSRKGQFRLIEQPNGSTLLEGTTWYTHKIKPAVYWQLWSNYIVHEIHGRVLKHIKNNSEQNIEPEAKN